MSRQSSHPVVLCLIAITSPHCAARHSDHSLSDNPRTPFARFLSFPLFTYPLRFAFPSAEQIRRNGGPLSHPAPSATEWCVCISHSWGQDIHHGGNLEEGAAVYERATSGALWGSVRSESRLRVGSESREAQPQDLLPLSPPHTRKATPTKRNPCAGRPRRLEKVGEWVFGVWFALRIPFGRRLHLARCVAGCLREGLVGRSFLPY
ncbi:hypothetical protein DFJ73DRAFT_866563 [Zopfochytrium polystomum]|nr:hypothetical protein DFJ73DRAFT_866563 [Zopfochytrium polystomum]